MAGAWKEVARLRFKGERFRDHALDLSAITELRQFQKIVAETAKALWRAAHPERKNLPPHFEERTRLCLRRIEDGSATVPLEVWVEAPKEPKLWEQTPEEVNQAIGLAYEVLDSVARDQPLPSNFPRELGRDYVAWGRSLEAGEEIELQAVNRDRPARVNRLIRERLERFVEQPYADSLEIVGEVQAADVRQQRFQVRMDDGTVVAAMFTEDQEELVTSALKDHRSVRMLVRGRVQLSPDGKPLKFTEVNELKLLRGHIPEYDPTAPSIEDELGRIATEVPPSEWEKLPSDLSDRLDYHLYGTSDE